MKGICCAETKAAVEARTSAESNKRRRSVSRRKIRCCCSQSFMAFGLRALSRSMVTSVCELAAQFLALAEKRAATVPLMIGHRMIG